MTATEYRAVLARLGLSIYGAGPKLGVTGRTSQRWAAGKTPIPERTQLLLKLMLKATR